MDESCDLGPVWRVEGSAWRKGSADKHLDGIVRT